MNFKKNNKLKEYSNGERNNNENDDKFTYKNNNDLNEEYTSDTNSNHRNQSLFKLTKFNSNRKDFDACSYNPENNFDSKALFEDNNAMKKNLSSSNQQFLSSKQNNKLGINRSFSNLIPNYKNYKQENSSNKSLKENNEGYNEPGKDHFIVENAYLKFRIDELNKLHIDILAKLNQKSETIIKLEEYISDLKENNQQNLKRISIIDTLIADNKYLELKNTNLIKLNNELLMEIDQLKELIQSKENDIRDLEEVLKLTENKILYYDSLIENLELSNKFTNEKNVDLTNNKDENHYNNFEEIIKNQQNELELKRTLIDQLEAKIKSLNHDIEIKDNKYDSKVSKREEDLKDEYEFQIKELKTRNIEKSNENLNLQLEISELKQKIILDHTSSKNIQANVDILNNKICELKEQNNKYKSQIQQYLKSNSSNNVRISKMNSKINILEEDIKSKSAIIDNYKEEVENLKQSVEILSREHENEIVQLELNNQDTLKNVTHRQVLSSLTSHYTKNESFCNDKNSHIVHINSKSNQFNKISFLPVKIESFCIFSMLENKIKINDYNLLKEKKKVLDSLKDIKIEYSNVKTNYGANTKILKEELLNLQNLNKELSDENNNLKNEIENYYLNNVNNSNQIKKNKSSLLNSELKDTNEVNTLKFEIMRLLTINKGIVNQISLISFNINDICKSMQQKSKENKDLKPFTLEFKKIIDKINCLCRENDIKQKY